MQQKFLCCSVDDELLFEGYQCACKKSKTSFPDTWYCVDEQRSWGANPNGPDDVSLNMAKYYLDGDTIINDMTYTRLFYHSDAKDIHGMAYKDAYIGGLRFNEDTTKVYIRPWGSQYYNVKDDYLLFDYTIKEGDTCYAFCGGVDDWMYCNEFGYMDSIIQPMECIKIDTIDSQRYFTMDIYYYYDGYVPFAHRYIWIEGIGTTFGLFTSAHTINSQEEQYSDHPLLCALRGDEVLYSRPDSELTHIGHHGVLNHCSSFEVIRSDIENNDIWGGATLDLSAPMYNVLGQPVDKDYRGVVIQNGRKYIK